MSGEADELVEQLLDENDNMSIYLIEALSLLEGYLAFAQANVDDIDPQEMTELLNDTSEFLGQFVIPKKCIH